MMENLMMGNRAYRGMNILERMSEISMELRKLDKDISVDLPNGKTYKAISDVAVTDAVKMAEAKWGVYSYPHGGVFTEKLMDCISAQGAHYQQIVLRYDVQYRFACIDCPQDYIDVPSCGVGIDPSDKASGKAMTYSRKYAYLQGYRIPTTELDGDNEASAPTYNGRMVSTPMAQTVNAAPVQPTAVIGKVIPPPAASAPVLNMEVTPPEPSELPFMMEEPAAPIVVEPVKTPEPQTEPPKSVSDGSGDIDEETARAFVVDNGMYKGKTLGDLMLSDPSFIHFAVNKMRRTEKNMPVIRACEVLAKLIA